MRIQVFVKGLLLGAGIAVGVIGTVALAVTVGTVKTWTTGEALVADDLNTSIGNLKKAIEGLPNWTKSGANAVYTDGNVGIGTSSPSAAMDVGGAISTQNGGIRWKLLSGTVDGSGNLRVTHGLDYQKILFDFISYLDISSGRQMTVVGKVDESAIFIDMMGANAANKPCKVVVFYTE
ncbi:MAG: hypothetical protein HYT87_16580 [Nitrospirae bacterium]|nr:hypothetical protein [Nitrospirota bacterium]